MSHIVTIKTQVRDVAAIQAACERLQLPASYHGTFDVYKVRATGWGIQLKNWQFPVVCDLAAGELFYDNFEGRWGDPKCLDEFLQRYAVEKTLLEARRQGYAAMEQPLENGSIRVVIQTN